MARLVLDRVGKQYEGGAFAVENINLSIDKKDFVIFVGPSGCGKSTILRMIAGLEPVSMGGIYIDGKPLNKKMAAKGDIAMVFQNYALYPHMSVYDNIAYSMKIKHVPKDEIHQKIIQVAKDLDLIERICHRPNELSGGQKQRVAMGRAIIRTPKLFLMDEPLSNLDAKLRTQMRREIQDLYQHTDATFLYVTHDQTEAMTLGTCIVVLNDGKIQQVSSPKELYYDPVNKFVAGFIGSPQINFLQAKVVQERTRIKLDFGDMGVFFLTDRQAEVMRRNSVLGKEITVGVRPESVKLMENYKDFSENCLSGVLKVYEPDGAVGYLYLEQGGYNVTIRVDGTRSFKLEQRMSFSFDEESMYFFDLESGVRIR